MPMKASIDAWVQTSAETASKLKVHKLVSTKLWAYVLSYNMGGHFTAAGVDLCHCAAF